jgi:sugar phosphate isomerase/epimerase
LAAGTLAIPRFAFATPKHQPLGVQLYTVRQQAERDLNGVLAQIRSIGYEEVEPYWNVYNRPASELKRMITDNGLRVPSGHFDYDGIESKLDYARELGVEYLVCPMLPENVRTGGPEGFVQAADRLNRYGELARARAMKFCFHNHNYEFRQLGDTTGFDLLMKHTDPALVGLELDCYWITQAGRDPVQMLHQYADRIHLLHLKDRKPAVANSQELNKAAEHFIEVGSGIIRWPEIIATAQGQGISHFFVEQDECDRPPIGSLKLSYHYLRTILP